MTAPTHRGSGSDRVRDALREEELPADELGRLRMERQLVMAAATGATFGVRGAERPRRRRTGVIVASGAAVAIAAAALFVLLRGDEPATPVPTVATFQRYHAAERADRGVVEIGQFVRTRDDERVEVRFDGSRVDVVPGSVAQFVRVSAQRTDVHLDDGAVEVQFHPEPGRGQALGVTTRVAHVEVVGTAFRVEVEPDGSTNVTVDEGIVRVVSLVEEGAAGVALVRAGEAHRVRSRASAPAGLADYEEVAPWLESRAPGEPHAASRDDVEVDVEGSASPPEPGGVASAASAAGESLAEPTEEDLVPPTEVDAETEALGRELSLDARFDLAETLQARGRHQQSRHILYGIARSPVNVAHRVRAWTLIAESCTAEHDYVRAAGAYRRAASAGGSSVGAQNALFALARLRERQMHDCRGALAAYEEYLRMAPYGAHATRSAEAIRRMEDRCWE